MWTVASNPGRVRVDLFHLFRCYPVEVLFWVGVGVLAVCLIPVSTTGATIVGTVAIGGLIRTSLQWRRHFWDRDLCPGVVLDGERGLIAAWTDLSRRGEPCPAVRIRKVPLKRATGRLLKRGTRLATVASYQGYLHERRWRNFAPIPIQCATRNQTVIKEALSRIPEEDWRQLAYAVRLLPRPFEPGLYLVEELEDAAEAEQMGMPRPKVRRRSAGPKPGVLFWVGVGFLAVCGLFIIFAVAVGLLARRNAQPPAPAMPPGMAAPHPVHPNPNPLMAPPRGRPDRVNQPADHGPPELGLRMTPAEWARQHLGDRRNLPARTSPSEARSTAPSPSREQPPARPAEGAGEPSESTKEPASSPNSARNPAAERPPSGDQATAGDEKAGSAKTEQPLHPGQRVEVRWGASWYPAQVIRVFPDGSAKIHYIGWDSFFDEIVPAERIRRPTKSPSSKDAGNK